MSGLGGYSLLGPGFNPQSCTITAQYKHNHTPPTLQVMRQTWNSSDLETEVGGPGVQGLS